MTSANDALQDLDDRALGELLRAAGRRPAPSREQMARWRRVFESELTVARRRRRMRRLGLAAGICAAAAALVVVVWLPSRVAEPAPVVADVRLAQGGTVVRRGEDVDVLAAGAAVRSGQRVEVGLASRLGVRIGGADVRLDESTTVIFRKAALELLRGRVYVDTGAADAASDGGAGALVVETPAGRFRHVGTQFLVAVADGQVTGAVREGSIVFEQDGRQRVVHAMADQAYRVEVSAAGVVREKPAAAHGPLWSWAEAASPGLVLTGRAAHEVLEWIARERGLRLDYASAEARRLALEARLAGSGEALLPGPALEVIEAATGLHTRVDDDATLLAGLPSEGEHHPQ